MPQATPTRTTDRDRLRSRPSVNSRSLTAENTPVLFRLPIVIAPPHAHARNAVTDSSSPLHDHAPPYRDQLAAGAVAAGAVSPSGYATGAVSPSERHPSSEERSLPPQESAVSPGDPSERRESAVSPSERVSEPAVELTAANKATWWEHWSSGVVLILLIIALVTASILALNDGSKSTTDQLAGEPVAALDEFDLSNITIPDVISGTAEKSPQATQTTQNPESQLTTAPTQSTADTQTPTTTQLNTTSNLELTTATSSNAPELIESALSLPAPSATLPALSVSTPEATNSPPGSLGPTAQASLSPPANANLAPHTPTMTAASMLETGSAPLASLTSPESVSPPPLFEPNSTADLSSQLPPLPTFNTSGSSPALYDGADGGNELQTAPQEQSGGDLTRPMSMPQMSHRSSSMPGMLTTAAPIDTNLPSFATVLTSASQSVLPAVNSAAQPTTIPSPIPSATPDSDAAAVVNAYLHFSEINRASNGVITNRWGTPTTTSPPATGASAPATGMGFTLGNQPAQ